MTQIYLRPELVTSNGEACGIMFDEQYVGSLTLIYREEDRLYGSIQLDRDFLDKEEKEEIDYFVHRYVQNKVNALGVPDCLVTVTYSEYDHIVATDLEDEDMDLEEDDDQEDEDDLYVDVYADEDVSIHFELIRDDLDTLTLDVYADEEERGSRIGMMTINLDEREITALLDFINPRDKVFREQIAYQLIEELERELEFETLTLTMQYDNEVIDEFSFDVREQVKQ